jgi:hypothetical protein
MPNNQMHYKRKKDLLKVQVGHPVFLKKMVLYQNKKSPTRGLFLFRQLNKNDTENRLRYKRKKQYLNFQTADLFFNYLITWFSRRGSNFFHSLHHFYGQVLKQEKPPCGRLFLIIYLLT